MKRKSSSIDVSSERVCFNDDDDTKVDSFFSDDAVPLHHFHLGQEIYAAVTYFANAVQIHLRQYGRNDNNRPFPTKRGVFGVLGRVLNENFKMHIFEYSEGTTLKYSESNCKGGVVDLVEEGLPRYNPKNILF
ncbi:hypothetical protein NPIL_37721 [Nephila pilipes]|uniref:Uncharacterized protein n=1 Tax=Nephila pilipes TaxID=299642 RepID=A0A8X6R1X0_NEPPI|nr:hypothetical protein NPIL_123151 [Nephila pilipes]GFU44238.1 hypothetical protein NPIL_37721 [Nephila pilipes]